MGGVEQSGRNRSTNMRGRETEGGRGWGKRGGGWGSKSKFIVVTDLAIAHVGVGPAGVARAVIVPTAALVLSTPWSTAAFVDVTPTLATIVANVDAIWIV